MAYAMARGASENWFWLSMTLDFFLGILLLDALKACARYRHVVKAVDEMKAASTKWVGRCND
jgi:hypothetical protein